jgi:hypothetical protein
MGGADLKKNMYKNKIRTSRSAVMVAFVC